jgi:integrase/recombinase XerD
MKNQLKHSDYTLTKQQTLNIINSVGNLRDRSIIKCLYYAGMRASEVVNLMTDDVDFENNTITIYQGKNKKTRKIPFIDGAFKTDLRFYIGNRKRAHVFEITRRETVNRVCKIAGEKAGVEHPHPLKRNINPHLFRHSIARHLKTDGISWEFIQNFLGHESFKTTMDTYGTMGFDEMQQIAMRRDPSLMRREKVIGEIQYER